MPDRLRHRREELTDVLHERVRQVTYEAARSAAKSAHAVALAIDVFEHRAAFLAALQTARRVGAEDQHALFLREFERVYAASRHRLTAVPGRADLLAEWSQLLIAALASVEAILSEGGEPVRTTPPVPFHHFLDDEDLEIIEIDRELDSDLSGRAIAEAWQP